jgi:hypothetical protein
VVGPATANARRSMLDARGGGEGYFSYGASVLVRPVKQGGGASGQEGDTWPGLQIETTQHLRGLEGPFPGRRKGQPRFQFSLNLP